MKTPPHSSLSDRPIVLLLPTEGNIATEDSRVSCFEIWNILRQNWLRYQTQHNVGCQCVRYLPPSPSRKRGQCLTMHKRAPWNGTVYREYRKFLASEKWMVFGRKWWEETLSHHMHVATPNMKHWKFCTIVKYLMRMLFLSFDVHRALRQDDFMILFTNVGARVSTPWPFTATKSKRRVILCSETFATARVAWWWPPMSRSEVINGGDVC